MSSATRQVVCLQDFALSKRLEHAELRGCYRVRPDLPTNCGSPAWAAARTSTYVGAQFRRFHRHFGQKGGKKAATATAHTLIVIIWHVLAESSAYRDLGSDYFTRRIDSPRARERRLIRELEALGHKVILEPTVA